MLFDLSIADATARTERRGNGTHRGDRLDAEGDDFHTRVREAYLQLARDEPERIMIVKSNQPLEVTQQRVKEIIIPFLRNRGHVLSEPPALAGG